MEINVIIIAILLACKESIERQLKNHDMQLNKWIDLLEQNEENEKDIENYGKVTDTGKKHDG